MVRCSFASIYEKHEGTYRKLANGDDAKDSIAAKTLSSAASGGPLNCVGCADVLTCISNISHESTSVLNMSVGVMYNQVRKVFLIH